MLFKTRFHAALRAGRIDLTFRRWATAKVKVGGSYRFDHSGGALVVDSIDTVPFGKITPREAKRAGFDSIDALKAALAAGSAPVTARTMVYRVEFHFDRDGARPAAPAPVTAADVTAAIARLERMDRLSRRGPWTSHVLALIAKHPQRRAGDLAPTLDRELRAFKADVRKLKGMGLTKSFEVGYELTALGRRVLKSMQGRPPARP